MGKRGKVKGHKKYWQLAIFILGALLLTLIISTQNTHRKIPLIQGLQIAEIQGNIVCKEFEDNVLWTSNYAKSKEGSTTYHAWMPDTNCTEAGGKGCSLQRISIDVRALYFAQNDEEINGEGYIQISDPSELICSNPSEGVYSKYLAYESIKGLDGQARGWYCGMNKISSEELDSQCIVNLNENIVGKAGCYGIKARAPQYTIIDVFRVRYRWCWENSDAVNEEKRSEK